MALRVEIRGFLLFFILKRPCKLYEFYHIIKTIYLTNNDTKGIYMIEKRIRNVCLTILLAGGLIWGAAGGIMISSGEEEKNPTTPIEDLEPVKQSTKVKINDLSKAFDILLNQGEVGFFEEYPVDMSFLHWVNNNYGEAVTMDLAYRLYEGYIDTNLWYLETGSSMHVLWLEYCKDLGFATYYLDNVTWLAEGEERTVTIDFTGDINLADDWYTMEAVQTRENGIYDCIDPLIISELQGADLSVVNNEFVFSDRGTPQEGKAYTFRAQPSNVKLLEVFGADLANLANNHVCDFYDEGLLDTIEILKNAGIETMGAGANITEASVIHYYVANGKKIAIVAASEIERFYHFTKEATETSAGVLKTLDPAIFCRLIKEAKENCDYVIADVHWGTEGTYKYSGSQYNLAEHFVEAGADMIIGGHPHRMQGVEYVDGAACLFSLGNFWFSTGALYTTIAQVQVAVDGSIDLRLIPCIQKNRSVMMLNEEESGSFYEFVADISKSIIIDGEGVVHNTKEGQNQDLKADGNYISESSYGTYDTWVDLYGSPIDEIGNLINGEKQQ